MTHHIPPSRHSLIVTAAIACFIDKGFHATSMRDIARSAGVSLGNLYNHFASKEALVAEVAMQERVELDPLLQELRDAPVPTFDIIKHFLRQYRTLCSQPEWGTLTAECLVYLARNPALAPRFLDTLSVLTQTLADALTRANDAGTLTLTIPAELVAQVLLDAIDSAALRALLQPTFVTRAVDHQDDYLPTRRASDVKAHDLSLPDLPPDRPLLDAPLPDDLPLDTLVNALLRSA
jgi:AcrR family transcriptional regulator